MNNDGLLDVKVDISRMGGDELRHELLQTVKELAGVEVECERLRKERDEARARVELVTRQVCLLLDHICSEVCLPDEQIEEIQATVEAAPAPLAVVEVELVRLSPVVDGVCDTAIIGRVDLPPGTYDAIILPPHSGESNEPIKGDDDGPKNNGGDSQNNDGRV